MSQLSCLYLFVEWDGLCFGHSTAETALGLRNAWAGLHFQSIHIRDFSDVGHLLHCAGSRLEDSLLLVVQNQRADNRDSQGSAERTATKHQTRTTPSLPGQNQF